jgi:general secretion pathway protein F
MPVFEYRGYRQDGSQTSGTLEADSVQQAASLIKSRGVYPKDITEYIHGRKRWFRKKLDRTLLPYLTRQLSTLLSSGVPLVDALRSLSEEGGGPWQGIIVSVREQVAGGASLSRALDGHRDIFPDFYIHMVAAGEQSGSLDKVLVRVADFLEKQAAIQSKLRTAMIYPTIMACVGFGVMAFLFTFVVPKIVKIFENMKGALPFVTVVLIWISNFFVHFWWAIILAIVLLIAGVRRLRASRRDVIDRIKLKAPGGVMQSLYLSRFSRTLGFLLEGGLPMLQALELSAKSLGNVVLEEKVKAAALRVAEGARLSSSLDAFPSVLLQLIATGEKSGTLSAILEKAATSYEEDFDRRVQKALSLLEPVMILVMGLIVGFIVFAVLLPMFELNQLVK